MVKVRAAGRAALSVALAAALVGTAAAKRADDSMLSSDGFSLISCTGAPNEIRLVVDNVRRGVGVLTVELYKNDASTWLRGEGRLVRKKFAARTPTTKVCLHAPGPGDYAIGMYHDRNNSDHFDRGPFGLPGEPYGVSNNPRMQFAPPSIGEALFHVPETSTTVSVRLRGP